MDPSGEPSGAAFVAGVFVVRFALSSPRDI
jgi:hypothetical protein